jgi:hypothetical protein
VSGEPHAPGALPTGKEPLVPIRGLVGPRTGLDDVECRKNLPLLGLELKLLVRPARSQSLYRLRCRYGYIIILKTVVLIYDFVFIHSMYMHRMG